MKSFKEGEFLFTFSDNWQVIKYDEHLDFVESQRFFKETMGLDFVGIYEGSLYLIEVKDYRKGKIDEKELPQEVAKKMRDTLALICGFYHTSERPGEWRPYIESLCKRETKIKAVLWLEERPRKDKKAKNSFLQNDLKAKLSWLTTHVLVCSQITQNGLPQLTVSDLAASLD